MISGKWPLCFSSGKWCNIYCKWLFWVINEINAKEDSQYSICYDIVSNYETCCHSLFFLSHPLYFSQYLSSMEVESIQHLQCWFYFDMLATFNISFQISSSSFLVLIYYLDFSPVVSLSGYNLCVCAHTCARTRACSVVSDSLWHCGL